MKLLVLGGTRFVGHAVVLDALARGWEVSALHRGVTGALPAGVRELRADRRDRSALRTALGDGEWDLVVDTWSDAPVVVDDTARLLVGRIGRYGYVSSASVYEWGQHVDESSPLVAGSARAASGDYPQLKRGAELAVVERFGDCGLLARPGLILGPHEDVGRLPWWLNRIARGGRVLAPGRPERPLQYVDVRDLAGWLLTALATGRQGPVDVVSRSGHATTASLLRACRQATGSAAELVWVDERTLLDQGVQPWTQLPCWVPETGEWAGFLEGDTSYAARLGLTCRPVEETVRDTWAWLQSGRVIPPRPERAAVGLPAEVERRVLAADCDAGDGGRFG